MILIFFDGSIFLIFFILLLMLIFQVELAVEVLLPIVHVLFLVLHIINTVVFVLKKKSVFSIVPALARLVLSFLRIEFYFFLLNTSVKEVHESAAGFATLSSLVGFVFVFFMMGWIFLLGELYSLGILSDTDPNPEVNGLIPETILTGICIASVFWLVL